MSFITIGTAMDLEFKDGHTVRSPQEYYQWQIEHLSRHARPHHSSVLLDARIEHGRWLADCVCHAGVLTHPLWKIACCAECGAIYENIRFPERWHLIELTLLRRLARVNQNWFPTESLRQLSDENEKHEVA